MSKHSDNIIVKHLAGSKAYGTSTPQSDTDYRGIFCAEKEYIISPFLGVKEFSDKSEEDTKYYELNNYMSLYLDGNPNILETLWVDEEDIVFKTEVYDILRSYAGELLSDNIAFTYTGFAHNQATRMNNHHTWIDKERNGLAKLQEIIDGTPCKQVKDWIAENFPSYVSGLLNFTGCDSLIRSPVYFDHYFRHQPIQMLSSRPLEQYHFIKLVHNYFPHQVLDRNFNIMQYNSGYELMPYGQNIFGVVAREGGKCINRDGSINKINTTNRPLEQIKQTPVLIVKFNKDEYEKSSNNRKSYHKWKEERNEDRASIEMKYGYDCKHAMHTVRLLRTVEEALTTGTIQVKRPDAEELLAIRNGAWTYEEMMEYWREKDAYITKVLYNKTVLPRTKNIKLATKVLIELREAQWYGKGK